ncbi:hypothetical protein BgiMline_009000 [Biomphalaria glabrata]|nr:hypothetical protein BgiMline_027578 [Biomphalaria glabrata]KAI8784588.1 hypothetical protein BgiBS90_014115 [Biomphalaria glabrata]
MLCIVYCIALACLTQFTQAGQENLQTFCTILNQTSENTNTCFEKPNNVERDPNDPVDPFIVTYICCLNAFNDVVYNYIPFIDTDFLLDIYHMTNENVLIDIAKFLQMCNRIPNDPYSHSDYNFWADNGRVSSKCNS